MLVDFYRWTIATNHYHADMGGMRFNIRLCRDGGDPPVTQVGSPLIRKLSQITPPPDTPTSGHLTIQESCTKALDSCTFFHNWPHSFRNKFNMPSYTETDVSNALEEMRNNVSLRCAARRHGIPRQTLSDRYHGSQSSAEVNASKQRISTESE